MYDTKNYNERGFEHSIGFITLSSNQYFFIKYIELSFEFSIFSKSI